MATEYQTSNLPLGEGGMSSISNALAGNPTKFDSAIAKYAQAAGVDPNLMKILVGAESSFRPDVGSSKGALGLTQMTPIAVKDVNQRYGTNFTMEDMTDPNKALEAGSLHFKTMLNTFDGDTTAALAAYNAGPGTVRGAIDTTGNPIPEYKETQDYVSKILSQYNDLPTDTSFQLPTTPGEVFPSSGDLKTIENKGIQVNDAGGSFQDNTSSWPGLQGLLAGSRPDDILGQTSSVENLLAKEYDNTLYPNNNLSKAYEWWKSQPITADMNEDDLFPSFHSPEALGVTPKKFENVPGVGLTDAGARQILADTQPPPNQTLPGVPGVSPQRQGGDIQRQPDIQSIVKLLSGQPPDTPGLGADVRGMQESILGTPDTPAKGVAPPPPQLGPSRAGFDQNRDLQAVMSRQNLTGSPVGVPQSLQDAAIGATGVGGAGGLGGGVGVQPTSIPDRSAQTGVGVGQGFGQGLDAFQQMLAGGQQASPLPGVTGGQPSPGSLPGIDVSQVMNPPTPLQAGAVQALQGGTPGGSTIADAPDPNGVTLAGGQSLFGGSTPAPTQDQVSVGTPANVPPVPDVSKMQFGPGEQAFQEGAAQDLTAELAGGNKPEKSLWDKTLGDPMVQQMMFSLGESIGGEGSVGAKLAQGGRVMQQSMLGNDYTEALKKDPNAPRPRGISNDSALAIEKQYIKDPLAAELKQSQISYNNARTDKLKDDLGDTDFQKQRLLHNHVHKMAINALRQKYGDVEGAFSTALDANGNPTFIVDKWGISGMKEDYDNIINKGVNDMGLDPAWSTVFDIGNSTATPSLNIATLPGSPTNPSPITSVKDIDAPGEYAIGGNIIYFDGTGYHYWNPDSSAWESE